MSTGRPAAHAVVVCALAGAVLWTGMFLALVLAGVL